MNRKIILALIAILLAVATGAIFWSMREAPVATGPAVPTFDYAAEGSWAVQPKLPPPAVWETGWEVDVILLASDAALEISDRVALEKRRDAAAEDLTGIAAAFEKIGPVYAPYLRAATANADMANALGQYLATRNRGRAFLIATDRPLPDTLRPHFETDPLLRDRFGGVLLYGQDNSGDGNPAGAPGEVVCSRRFKADEGCVERIELRRAGGRYELSGGERLTNGLVTWLNDHTSKLAEPLGDFEEIEIIDIRRPGETD
ncbi:MAG: hypothetical protein ACK4P2_08170 [Hyphomonas sp.]